METRPVLDSNNFIFHSTSSQYFHPIFLENSYYENIENEKRQEKKQVKEGSIK